MITRMKGVLALTALVLLSGCQSLTGTAASPQGCGEVPTFADNVCLLDSWVAFGLDAQRADKEWREMMLDRLAGSRPNQKAARAVVLGWDAPQDWRRASELYKASINSAPTRLQPLLQQWLNGLEKRRQLYAQRASSAGEGGDQALKRENQALKQQLKEMSDKLDALTDIERTINSRD
ncbi:hypothetical protein [Salinicola sp. RZ23]|uniref:hypothetical protein n=1 Tax=Salinicola sp. RZ23 TaxID=1949087 RepID=UPI000DA193C6|nr:hypothetical protein [Salinicola sp. RZ23]